MRPKKLLEDSSCSIDDVIVYGRNELWVIKKAHGQVSS